MSQPTGHRGRQQSGSESASTGCRRGCRFCGSNLSEPSRDPTRDSSPSTASLVAPIWAAARRPTSAARRSWSAPRCGAPAGTTSGSARWWRWPGVGVKTRRVRASRAPDRRVIDNKHTNRCCRTCPHDSPSGCALTHTDAWWRRRRRRNATSGERLFSITPPTRARHPRGGRGAHGRTADGAGGDGGGGGGGGGKVEGDDRGGHGVVRRRRAGRRLAWHACGVRAHDSGARGVVPVRCSVFSCAPYIDTWQKDWTSPPRYARNAQLSQARRSAGRGWTHSVSPPPQDGLDHEG